jgi:dienelactone hydrolase
MDYLSGSSDWVSVGARDADGGAVHAERARPVFPREASRPGRVLCADVVAYGGATPLLMPLGELDEWTSPETCRLVALGARRAGRDVVDVLYPGAHHGFDTAHMPRPIRIADARGGRGATVAYNPSAHADAERRVGEFLARHLRPN